MTFARLHWTRSRMVPSRSAPKPESASAWPRRSWSRRSCRRREPPGLCAAPPHCSVPEATCLLRLEPVCRHGPRHQFVQSNLEHLGHQSSIPESPSTQDQKVFDWPREDPTQEEAGLMLWSIYYNKQGRTGCGNIA